MVARVDFLLIRTTHRGSLGLPDQRDDRYVVEFGVVEPVEEVDTAGTTGRGTYADLTGEFRVPDGLERAHLLVARLHELRIVLRANPGRQQAVDAVAGVAENLPDPPLPKALQHDVGDGLGHGFSSGRRPGR